MEKINDTIICWWSGGVTSAVACRLATMMYSKCRVVFIDTMNEDIDTYRFNKHCENVWGITIERIYNPDYPLSPVQSVWRKYNSLNNATGAICSSELKRTTRERFQKENAFTHQVFGFDINEGKRMKAMKKNYPECKAVFPLAFYGMSKEDCIGFLNNEGIDIPSAYKLGFQNNNCLKTGCVQGGVGYWQKMKEEFPEKFLAMADMEHELTNIKRQPVTMLKDQSKHGGLVFLLPHPSYPDIKDISMMKGRPPKPLTDCNGFCGINDLEKRSETELEINYQS